MYKKAVSVIAAGIIWTGSGVFGLFGASACFAEGVSRPEASQSAAEEPFRMTDEGAAKRAAEDFGVDESEVRAYLASHPGAYRDIFPCAMMAKISGRSFGDVMAAYDETGDWRSVRENFGITRDMIHETMGEIMGARIADKKTNLTADEAKTLIREGYRPRDVRAAGVIGKAAGISAGEVLSMKRINNRWEDVTAELGLDPAVLKEALSPGWMMSHRE